MRNDNSWFQASGIETFSSRWFLPSVCFLLLVPFASAGESPCGWWNGFHARDLNHDVFEVASWDDGTGDSLFVGGKFTLAGDREATGLARWQGVHWEPVLGSGGGGLEGTRVEVRALVAWDDGSGEALYVGGDFETADGSTVNNIAKWNGSDFQPLTGSFGTGLDGTGFALSVWDDGSGEKLYVGGDFETAGGIPASFLASWDGQEWEAVAAGGLDGRVLALHPWNGSLYAGGEFGGTTDSTVDLNYVARLDDLGWSPLESVAGEGVDDDVKAFVEWNGELVLSGAFSEAGGLPVSSLARWDGSSWSAFSSHEFDSQVKDLVVWNDGAGDRLYVVGEFDSIDGIPSSGFAVWTGTEWSSLGSFATGGPSGGERSAIHPWNTGDGEALFVAGRFLVADGRAVGNIAQWDGSALAPLSRIGLGFGDEGTYDSTIDHLLTWDDGNGEALYAIGELVGAGETETPFVGRWDGVSWGRLGETGTGVFDGQYLKAALVWESELYVAGNFDEIDGEIFNNIARWDGSTWHPLTGSMGTGTDSRVFDLEIWDDGNGPALYVAGRFEAAGGVAASRVAKWDGVEWSALGSGVDNSVFDLVVWDDGGGERLYLGGDFTMAGGLVVNHLAEWDGSTWSALTGVAGTGVDDEVASLEVWNDVLFVGGEFETAGGVQAIGIARWDGSDFSALIDGDSRGVLLDVKDMHSHDGALIVGGRELDGPAPATAVGSIARWDGSSWSQLDLPAGELSQGAVNALASYDAGYPGGGSALFAAGDLERAGGILSSHIGAWSCDAVAPSEPVDLDSTTHTIGEWSIQNEITVEWNGASDVGSSGLHGYSYVFDRSQLTEPDSRLEQLHVEGEVGSATSKPLGPGDRHFFHLRTCDRRGSCLTSHLGPFFVGDGPHLFSDGFESGDLDQWSSSSP